MSINSVSQVNSSLAYKPNGFQRFLAKAGYSLNNTICDVFDLSSKGSLKRMTFVGIAAVFLLGARFYQARNRDEKREVFTRDFSAVVAAVYGVPILKKFAGMFISKKTGVPIVSGERGFIKNLNPEKGVIMASYEQLKQWFSVKKEKTMEESIKAFDKIQGKFTGFVRNLKNLGCDVLKGFNTLNKEESQKAIKELAKHLGYDHQKITNDNIVELIGKAEKSTDAKVTKHLDVLKGLFVGENKLYTKASHSKSAVEFSAIGATAFLLGGFLPWFNIQYTRHLYKDKKPQSRPLNNANINQISKSEEFKLFAGGL